MRERFQRFMRGRYGNDQLNQFIFVLAAIAMVIELVARLRFFYVLALVLLVLGYYRAFSKNINQRYQENYRFLVKKDNILNHFRKNKINMADRKQNHIYSCKSCGQKIRIPRGKGKIEIRCPKCGNKFIKHS